MTLKQLTKKLNKLYTANVPVSEICQKLGITETRLNSLKASNGIKRNSISRRPRRAWTNSEIEYLKANYNNVGIEELVEKLERPLRSIRIKARTLNAVNTAERAMNKHRKIADAYLELRGTNNVSECATQLRVSMCQLYKILNKFNIDYKKPSKKNMSGSLYGTIWSKSEIQKLKVLYKNTKIKDCAFILGRTFNAVSSKIKELQIQKQIQKR